MVTRRGGEIPLIPRYFDLLVLLIERRDQAVHRTDILDRVWSDVIVSDGALSQAVRILRRALGDTAREPLFIRTLSRHGYRFIHPGVVEEAEEESSHPSAVMTTAGALMPDPAGPVLAPG
jgi:DNA-binding winged helix-turn-helix (wHTH) protein